MAIAHCIISLLRAPHAGTRSRFDFTIGMLCFSLQRFALARRAALSSRDYF